MKLSRNLIIFIVMAIGTMAAFAYFTPAAEKPEEIGLSQAIAMSQNGEIETTVKDNENLLMTTTEGLELTTTIGNRSLVDLQELGFNFEGMDFSIKPQHKAVGV